MINSITMSQLNGLFTCRFLSLFVLDEVVSDNAMISIYPLGDGELYAFAETPFIHRIDKVSLETTGRVSCPA